MGNGICLTGICNFAEIQSLHKLVETFDVERGRKSPKLATEYY